MTLREAIMRPSVTVAAAAIAAIGAATLVGAWVMQYGFDIRPCPLCLQQRYAYYLAIPLAGLVAIGASRGVPRALIGACLGLIAAAMMANAALGAYHAGIEWGFWKGAADCTGPVGDFGGGNLLQELRNTSVKVIRCDEVQWRFLGLSLAGYNVLISALMAAIAVVAMGRPRAA
jgi:disulfide bond formation protein DsbB